MQELHCRSVHKCVFIPNIPKKSFEEEFKLKWKKKEKEKKIEIEEKRFGTAEAQIL